MSETHYTGHTSRSTTSALTVGQYRVGISFNPGGHPEVNEIKQKAAELIDLIRGITTSHPVLAIEVSRLKALAEARVEEAAMWGVKAVTKPLSA